LASLLFGDLQAPSGHPHQERSPQVVNPKRWRGEKLTTGGREEEEEEEEKGVGMGGGDCKT